MKILGLSQWEARVGEVYSMARCIHISNSQLLSREAVHIHAEMNRTMGKGRAVYSLYIKGFVLGLCTAERTRLYREYLEHAYVIDGVIYSSRKGTVHRSMQDIYDADKAHLLNKNHHYWLGTDKIFY